MELEDNDPDTLQLKDELDTEWVKLWRQPTRKKTIKMQLTVDCIPPEKTNPTATSSPRQKIP